MIFPFAFVLSTFDVLSKMLRISLNDSQSFSQHGLGIWKTISFSPLPSMMKTFFVSRHYPFHFSFLFFSEKKGPFQHKDFKKCVFVSNESTQLSSINYLTAIREWNLPSVYTLLIFNIMYVGNSICFGSIFSYDDMFSQSNYENYQIFVNVNWPCTFIMGLCESRILNALVVTISCF